MECREPESRLDMLVFVLDKVIRKLWSCSRLPGDVRELRAFPVRKVKRGISNLRSKLPSDQALP